MTSVSGSVTWLNANSGAVQGIATVVLVLVTIWYSAMTRTMAQAASEQIAALRRSQEPDVSVQIVMGFQTELANHAIPYYAIVVRNHGQAPVTIHEPFFVSDDARLSIEPRHLARTDSFPMRLNLGDDCSLEVFGMGIASALRKRGLSGQQMLQARAADDRGIVHESFEYPIDLERWLIDGALGDDTPQ